MMNKNARAKIETRTVGNRRYTDTADRDYGSPNVSIETVQLGTGSRTKLTLMGFGGAGCCIRSLDLNGHEARTLYRVLEKHYGYAGALKAARADKDESKKKPNIIHQINKLVIYMKKQKNSKIIPQD
jgi:hypothetical protein